MYKNMKQEYTTKIQNFESSYLYHFNCIFDFRGQSKQVYKYTSKIQKYQCSIFLECQN